MVFPFALKEQSLFQKRRRAPTALLRCAPCSLLVNSIEAQRSGNFCFLSAPEPPSLTLTPGLRSGPAVPSRQPAAPGSSRLAQHPATRPPDHPRCRCPASLATASLPPEAFCVHSWLQLVP